MRGRGLSAAFFLCVLGPSVLSLALPLRTFARRPAPSELLGAALLQSVEKSGSYALLRVAFQKTELRELRTLDSSERKSHVRALAEELVAGQAALVGGREVEVPEFVVCGSALERLLTEVLKSGQLVGAWKLVAEEGAGKSVAAALAATNRENTDPGVAVVLHGPLDENLRSLFKVPNTAWALQIAPELFKELRERGCHLQLVLDTDDSNGTLAPELGRAAEDFDHGVLVLARSSGEAEDGTSLVPRRWWDLRPRSKAYRWTREEASTYLRFAQLRSLVATGSGDGGDAAAAAVAALPRRELRRKLRSARKRDWVGGWTPLELAHIDAGA
ncbi:unnamed protein product [Effrenium voratum]|uniref:Uncharacterized protein n=1 Tax=Effrenium voratum TaxID=2562239 RepID=A0AA36HYX3_9DINO|nr:unnamed protein product [Effrenium voratum]